MPRHDDGGIPDNAILIRAVDPGWIRSENGVERLTSATFLSGQLETSCFVSEEVGGIEGFCSDILPHLSTLLGKQLQVATIPVSLVRSSGLWVYRKPKEFYDNPAHVVICPPDGMSKSQYKKRSEALAPAATRIVPPSAAQ